MTILESIILAIVEGLTEFLPVSSTGHMILTEGILGMESTAYLKAFTVMIQFGAILSVVVYYFRRFLPFPILGLKPDPTTSLGGWRLYGLMIVGCIPAAILGALFNETIDTLLGSTWVVLGMRFLGGILMIYFDRIFTNKTERPVQVQNAFIIGLFQCLAMIPPSVSPADAAADVAVVAEAAAAARVAVVEAAAAAGARKAAAAHVPRGRRPRDSSPARVSAPRAPMARARSAASPARLRAARVAAVARASL